MSTAHPAPEPARAVTGERDVEWALRERVKELTCLYAIAHVTARAGHDLDEAMRGVVDALPPAWQYPAVTQARVALDDRSWTSAGFGAAAAAQGADVLVDGEVRGRVEVGYREARPDADEGPFLREERALIDEVARQVGVFAERHAAAAERERLRQQLWRSDRLGTVGQLAAGLAHELNEPLGAILGYAQLARKSFGLPDQTGRDLDKVVRASLHARDIIRRLLVFARTAPSRDQRVALDEMVRESLFLLESRCRRAGVKVALKLAPDVPAVPADRALLAQAFLNLAVNGIQAMPDGGTLTVATEHAGNDVRLVVEDTGAGMSEDVARHCFDPFFTTKDVGQGTGLGLAVTHGIVTSHGGSIEVASAPGAGARFTVRLPLDPVPESPS